MPAGTLFTLFCGNQIELTWKCGTEGGGEGGGSCRRRHHFWEHNFLMLVSFFLCRFKSIRMARQLNLNLSNHSPKDPGRTICISSVTRRSAIRPSTSALHRPTIAAKVERNFSPKKFINWPSRLKMKQGRTSCLFQDGDLSA